MNKEAVIKTLGLYLGCEIETPSGMLSELDTYWLNKIAQHCGEPEFQIKLLTRSLSDITDEEAIEVARMAHPDGENYTWEASPVMGEVTYVKAEGFRVAIWYDDAGVFIDRLTKECPTHNDHLITDYLRSRGFDLPTYFLGGKKPSECNLAILKDKA